MAADYQIVLRGTRLNLIRQTHAVKEILLSASKPFIPQRGAEWVAGHDRSAGGRRAANHWFNASNLTFLYHTLWP